MMDGELLRLVDAPQLPRVKTSGSAVSRQLHSPVLGLHPLAVGAQFLHSQTLTFQQVWIPMLTRFCLEILYSPHATAFLLSYNYLTKKTLTRTRYNLGYSRESSGDNDNQ